MEAIGQDVAAARALLLEALPKALPKVSETRFRFLFLASPTRILGDEHGRVTQLEVEENILVRTNGDTRARGTGRKRLLDVETVIFAIGDRVDETFGLPVEWNEFVKNPNPRFPVEGNSYEAFDPEKGQPIEGVFVAGWSRNASSGLVGSARKDGANGARALWQYLQASQAPKPLNLEGIEQRLQSLGKPIVRKTDLPRLEAAEQAEARRRGLEVFKFSTNEEMLRAMGLIP
jgi:ferredoxin--NADP+ reductase